MLKFPCRQPGTSGTPTYAGIRISMKYFLYELDRYLLTIGRYPGTYYFNFLGAYNFEVEVPEC